MLNPAPVWLLDKNVVRRAIEGIGASLVASPLTAQQSLALRLLRRGKQANVVVMITPEVGNILSCRSNILEVPLFLREVDTLRRGRYFDGWARRLREHGFTREDAKILSYGTFGLDPAGLTLGVTVVVTFDLPFINNFRVQREDLARRLKAMAVQLPRPYHDARLPEMATPERVLQMLET